MTDLPRRWRPVALAALLLACATPRSAAAQPPVDDRAQLLDDLAAHRASLPLEELGTLLRGALADPDPAFKARGLAVVAGRAGAARFSQDDRILDAWRSERPLLRSLEPAALQALDDAATAVRKQAILALGNLQFVLGDNASTLPPTLLRAFADRYAREPDPSVRADLTYAVSVAPPLTDGRDAFLIKALDDGAPDVQAAALVGLGESSPPAALPAIAARLGSTDPAVRLNAAVAIQGYGTAARTYAARLRQALDAEDDPAIANTLRVALEGLGAP